MGDLGVRGKPFQEVSSSHEEGVSKTSAAESKSPGFVSRIFNALLGRSSRVRSIEGRVFTRVPGAPIRAKVESPGDGRTVGIWARLCRCFTRKSPDSQRPVTTELRGSVAETADTAARVSMGQFKEIARGAAKRILVPEDKGSLPDFDGKVLMTPTGRGKEGELREELQTMSDIAGEVKVHRGAGCLAVDVEEVSVGGANFALLAEAASGDLERIIQEPSIDLNQRLELVSQFLMGSEALHSTGRAYGDTKPENCLVYGDSTTGYSLKISDFGKTKQVGSGAGSYSGNTRFAAPEGQLSKAADVYANALVVIRILEEAVLEPGEKSLVEVEDKDVPASDKVRGVERFIVEHKAFLGCESKGIMGKIRSCWRRMMHLGKRPSLEQQEKQHGALSGYIAVLADRLGTKFGMSVSQQAGLQFVLGTMILSEPSHRYSMTGIVENFTQMVMPPRAEAPAVSSKLRSSVESGGLHKLRMSTGFKVPCSVFRDMLSRRGAAMA